ncbi:DUF1599 domain-containing protein [Lunatimonas salinarum]|uniref:DUF1599 domain-containing protein n=1 Tax=Lunatimonas salinarum TaxID=1774590 RepID=UPI001AE03A5B|nr:DUF1599 domain-containing protein [Lunatimonas salinarum]
MNTQTLSEYKEVIELCKELFKKKTLDYGTAWRILRLPSITDQVFIKAQRIRSIQEKGIQMVNEPVRDEFIGIINYCLIALIQSEISETAPLDISYVDLEPKYDYWVEETRKLLENKNHDYGEAWRMMRISSITDIILMKLYRIKQIEDNQGKTLVSEGIQANFQDILNYSVFCMIKLKEQNG